LSLGNLCRQFVGGAFFQFPIRHDDHMVPGGPRNSCFIMMVSQMAKPRMPYANLPMTFLHVNS
jgi:hypothetical protein